MPTEKFTFTGHEGHRLAGRLDRPEGPQRATALFAHCFTCSKDIAAARRISQRLAGLGIACLRFDFTGLGHSGGEFANTGFASNLADLREAAAALAARGMAPGLLVGHSLGGAAVIAAAGAIPSVKAVATIGAPFDPVHVTRHFAPALPSILADGSAEVSLAGRSFRIGRTLVEELSEVALSEALRGLPAALLILHAPRDATVGIDNATRLFLAARHPKSFVTLDSADHLLSDGADADYAAGVIAAWAARYLDLAEPAPPPGAPEGIVRVSEADPEGFLQDIALGPRHHLQADEPLGYGGSDLGPTPYGLVAAGLGACTAMTLRLYARRKGWPLAHVAVEVSHARVHAQDADGATPDRIDRFRRTIRLEGDLTAEMRQRLLEIADRCPVHRTLEAGALVETAPAP